MREKIWMICLIISLSALILQTMLYLRTSSDLIYTEAKEQNLQIMTNMQNEIERYVRSVENGLINLYNETEFILDLRKEWSGQELNKKWYRLAHTIASENFDTSVGVLALYLYNADDEIISTYRKATTPKHVYPLDIYDGTQDTNTEAIENYVASDNASMLISSYYNRYRGTDIARFAVKLYQTGTISKLIGYAICDVDSKGLRQLMKKYTNGAESYIWLQPFGDRPITATGTLEEKALSNYEASVEEIYGSVYGQEQITEKENQVFFQVQQKRYNLGSYAIMTQQILERNQRTLNRNLLLISIVISFVAILMSRPISRSLTRGLDRMTETMKRIQSGETELRMNNLQKDEIGELGDTFNEMLDRIEELIAGEYEAKLQINRAEYMALQAQINPHFLYNTLETMSSIAEIEECYELSALSQSLSNIFRYSLDMKHPFSTVGKEIAHLKNYIYVMNVRMRNEVEYEFDIENDTLSDTLPRISIQPLVENALNHGLRNVHGPKKICISVVKKGENLQICVEDNGVGIREDRLETLLEGDPAGQEKSIGLANIHSRMKLLYGEPFGVKIESREGVGTKVFLNIPRKKMEEVELWRAENIKS